MDDKTIHIKYVESKKVFTWSSAKGFIDEWQPESGTDKKWYVCLRNFDYENFRHMWE